MAPPMPSVTLLPVKLLSLTLSVLALSMAPPAKAALLLEKLQWSTFTVLSTRPMAPPLPEAAVFWEKLEWLTLSVPLLSL